MIYTSPSYPYINPDDIRKVQNIELSILVCFIDVCKSLDLTYYAYAGTLLGAIRHKGFIPWDDDIDVIMPRKDYEIFISKAKEYLPDYIEIDNVHTNKECGFIYTKLRDKNTTYIEYATKSRNQDMHGVWIDIFPMDLYEKEPSIVKRIKCRVLQSLILKKYEPLPIKKTIKRKIKDILKIPFYLPYIFLSQNKLALKLDALRKKHSSGNGYFPLKDHMHFGCDYSLYKEPIDAIFEGVVIKIPREFDACMKDLYGDYMKMPKEVERHGGHYIYAYSLKKQ